jgi:tetratricopeptide (TPR) repeat protein
MSAHAAGVHLQAGHEALRLALGGHPASPPRSPLEDPIPDPKALQAAQKHFEIAASLFKAEGRATDEARARIGLAEVYLNMPPTVDTCTAAEASCRAAIDVLDTAADPATSLNAYVLLGEAIAPTTVQAPERLAKEARIKRTLGVLRAAEYLADEQDDRLLRARVDAALSRVLGEKYSGDRDANLLDAIRAGHRALPEFRRALATSPLCYPSLQFHLGNCYMRLDGPRMRWLQEGLAAYKDGFDVVDPRSAPRLHHVLAGTVAGAEARIAAGDGSLPEKEMILRFRAKVQSALERKDVEGAHAAAWDMMRWGWSLDRVPNVWVAEAHKMLGTLLLQRGDPNRARDHFYSAAALLSALAEPGGPQQAALLAGARQLLGEAMTQLGQAGWTAELVRQADGAFPAAREHCARGSNLVAHDPKAAHEELERAVNLFPYDPLALFYRGVASMSIPDLEAARRDFDSVLTLQPRNRDALANRAVLRMKLGDTDGALTDWASVLEIYPQNVAALYNRASLRATAGDCEAAVKDLDQLLAAHPDVAEASALRAECLGRFGQSGSN